MTLSSPSSDLWGGGWVKLCWFFLCVSHPLAAASWCVVGSQPSGFSRMGDWKTPFARDSIPTMGTLLLPAALPLQEACLLSAARAHCCSRTHARTHTHSKALGDWDSHLVSIVTLITGADCGLPQPCGEITDKHPSAGQNTEAKNTEWPVQP